MILGLILKAVLPTILAVLLTILAVYFWIRYPSARAVINTIVVVIVFGGAIASAAYCGNQLNIYYQAEGGVIGYLSGIYGGVNKGELEDGKITLSDLEFRQVHDDLYSLSISTKPYGLQVEKNYTIHINGTPCTTSEYSYRSKSLFAEYEYNFYNATRDLLMKDTLAIRIAFYENNTSIILETNGGSAAVGYWLSYFNRYNAVLSIEETNYSKNDNLQLGEGAVPETCSVKFMVEDENYLSRIVLKDSFLTEVEKPNVNGKAFLGWSIDKVNVVDYTNLKVENDLILHAMFSESGLFDSETGECIYSWQEMLDNNILQVEDGVLTAVPNLEIDGSYKDNTALSGTLHVPNDVTSIGDHAFAYCVNLKGIALPDSVTSIGEYAFAGCTNMETISIPDSVTTLGRNVFSGCTALSEVRLSKNITEIPMHTFDGCSKLTEIEIPNAVKYIGQEGLASSGLKNINLNSVETIENLAFYNCSDLTAIYIPWTVTKIWTYGGAVQSPFYGCNSSLIIYCGAESAPADWQQYWNYNTQTTALTVKWGYSYSEYASEVNPKTLWTSAEEVVQRDLVDNGYLLPQHMTMLYSKYISDKGFEPENLKCFYYTEGLESLSANAQVRMIHLKYVGENNGAEIVDYVDCAVRTLDNEFVDGFGVMVAAMQQALGHYSVATPGSDYRAEI